MLCLYGIHFFFLFFFSKYFPAIICAVVYVLKNVKFISLGCLGNGFWLILLVLPLMLINHELREFIIEFVLFFGIWKWKCWYVCQCIKRISFVNVYNKFNSSLGNKLLRIFLIWFYLLLWGKTSQNFWRILLEVCAVEFNIFFFCEFFKPCF